MLSLHWPFLGPSPPWQASIGPCRQRHMAYHVPCHVLQHYCPVPPLGHFPFHHLQSVEVTFYFPTVDSDGGK